MKKVNLIVFIIGLFLIYTKAQEPIPNSLYKAKGIGGGGAMGGFSISPYNNLWIVGTDMGTLFRSHNQGKLWMALDQNQMTFHADLNYQSFTGFSSDKTTLFNAMLKLSGGEMTFYPRRSSDGGITWNEIDIDMGDDPIIRYWLGHSFDEDVILCATDSHLYFSNNKGDTWQQSNGFKGKSKGTFFDYETNKIYHATDSAIFISSDRAISFSLFYTPQQLPIRSFTGGRGNEGLTLAFIDSDGENASQDWINNHTSSEAQKEDVHNSTGFIWIKKDSSEFKKSIQYAGDHIRMAENDGMTIYCTGSRDWPWAYGTKVWISEDRGENWDLCFRQQNWDTVPYVTWPEEKFESSAVGHDVGYWDSGYRSFSVNRRNSSIAGGTGNFFLHVTRNKGKNWESPFTEYADVGPRGKGKKWKSTGLEMTSFYNLEFHPVNSQIGYASVADITGLVTEDGGESWRINCVNDQQNGIYYMNSIYDYAFDSRNDNLFYAAVSSFHDFPFMWYCNVLEGNGGIYKSPDRGLTWNRLTPRNDHLNRSFLSVAFDEKNNILYGGTHSIGVVRSVDGGVNWEVYNNGIFPGAGMIIPQIEINPQNGNVYALLAGDPTNGSISDSSYTNREYTGIYFLDVENNSTKWQLLRGETNPYPNQPINSKHWWYPTCFAIDFSNTNTLWLGDIEKNSTWLGSGIWKTTNRGQTWNRSLQYTHPTSITIDNHNPNNIYIGGRYTLSGNWGQGGAYYTNDGGTTWQKNDALPLKANLYNVTLDPNDESKLYYSFFGGGMLHGPRDPEDVSISSIINSNNHQNNNIFKNINNDISPSKPIHLNLPFKSEVSLYLINLQGKKIPILENVNLNAGSQIISVRDIKIAQTFNILVCEYTNNQKTYKEYKKILFMK